MIESKPGLRADRAGPSLTVLFSAAAMSPAFMTSPDHAKRVYLALCHHAGTAGESWHLGAEQLAEETLLSPRMAWQGLRDLVGRGLVNQGSPLVFEGRAYSTTYTVNDRRPLPPRLFVVGGRGVLT